MDMDALPTIISAVSLGLSILVGLLGWSVTRNIATMDGGITEAKAAAEKCKNDCKLDVSSVVQRVHLIELAHERTAKTDDLHELTKAVTRLEGQVQSLAKQIEDMAKPRRRTR